MNVLYIYSDLPQEWNCAEWRCQIPHDAINRLPDHEAKMIYINNWINDREYSEWADIIVVQRNMFSIYLSTTYYWRARGKVVVLDLDDAYSYMPSTCYTYTFWRNGLHHQGEKVMQMSYIPYEHLLYSTKIVNAITVASPVLYNDWCNKVKTYHIPNYPEILRYPIDKEKTEYGNPIVIGWGGGSTHFESFKDSNVIAALRRIKEKYNIKIKLVTNDKRIAQAMRIRDKGLEIVPYVHFTKWPEEIGKFDIGIVPLEGLYDRRRSAIKVIENLLMGIPTIATNYEPYYEFRDYVDLVDNRTKYWEEALENLIMHRDQNKIDKGKEFAKSCDINLNIHKTLQTYQEIINEGRILI
jgi:hypothetical protein